MTLRFKFFVSSESLFFAGCARISFGRRSAQVLLQLHMQHLLLLARLLGEDPLQEQMLIVGLKMALFFAPVTLQLGGNSVSIRSLQL